MMRACPGCGKSARSFTRATLFTQKGEARGANVCGECVKRGVLLVPERVAPVVTSSTKRSDAEVLAPFIQTAKAHARACQASLGKTDDAETRTRLESRMECWEAVAHLLKSGRT